MRPSQFGEAVLMLLLMDKHAYAYTSALLFSQLLWANLWCPCRQSCTISLPGIQADTGGCKCCRQHFQASSLWHVRQHERLYTQGAAIRHVAEVRRSTAGLNRMPACLPACSLACQPASLLACLLACCLPAAVPSMCIGLEVA